MVKFNEKLCQELVDGIQIGYKEYLSVRMDKRNSMRVSHGYSFVRANHIDDAVGNQLEGLIKKVRVKRTNGGWEYLEFDVKSETNCFFLIKERTRAASSTQRGKKESQYLIEYAKVNSHWIKKEGLRERFTAKGKVSMQLSLFSEDEQIRYSEHSHLKNYDYFYVVTYTVDPVSKFIDSIEVLALDPDTRYLYQIQDLTPYIQTSSISITEEETQAILAESEIGLGEEYGYAVPETASEDVG